MKNFKLIMLIVLLGCNQNGTEEATFPNGQLQYSVPLVDDKREGEYKEYFKNGKIKYISHWVKGVQQGKSIQFFENGNIKWNEMFVDGYPEGLISENYSSGNIKREMTYHNRKKEFEKTYFENGSLQSTVKLNYDSIMAKFYYDDGVLEETTLKVEDKLIFAKKFSRDGTFLSSKLPLKVSAKKESDSRVIEMQLRVEYSNCLDCFYLITFGELLEDKNGLVDERKRISFQDKLVNSALDKNLFKTDFVSGLLYEFDKDTVLQGVMPFKTKIEAK